MGPFQANTRYLTDPLRPTELHLSFFSSRSLDGVERELPEVVLSVKNSEETNSDPKKGNPAPTDDPRTILGGSVSSDGRLMALCDDRKQLSVWSCDDWSLVRQWPMQRRANRVIFSHDASAVLVAGIALLLIQLQLCKCGLVIASLRIRTDMELLTG